MAVRHLALRPRGGSAEAAARIAQAATAIARTGSGIVTGTETTTFQVVTGGDTRGARRWRRGDSSRGPLVMPGSRR